MKQVSNLRRSTNELDVIDKIKTVTQQCVSRRMNLNLNRRLVQLNRNPNHEPVHGLIHVVRVLLSISCSVIRAGRSKLKLKLGIESTNTEPDQLLFTIHFQIQGEHGYCYLRRTWILLFTIPIPITIPPSVSLRYEENNFKKNIENKFNQIDVNHVS